MKKILILLILTFSFAKTYSQAYKEGNVIVSAGYGFGTFSNIIAKAFDQELDFKYSSLGPVYLKGEYMVSSNVGFGLNIAYGSYAVDFSTAVDTNFDGFSDIKYKNKFKRTTTSALARFNFHFGNSEKFDPYLGLGMGWRTANYTNDYSDPDYQNTTDFNVAFPLGFETTIGARYYVVPAIGIYGEVGLGKSFFQVGLSGKF
jgi:hypothetical protein